MDKPFDRLIFFVFLSSIAAAFLFYAPGWGFMDDLGGIQKAGSFWSGKVSLTSLITQDMHLYGRFRPVYFLWIISAYWIKYPLLLYLLIFLTGSLVLWLWGKMLARILFKEPPAYVQWILPLGFFLFPAFWNIFMYISVQEKFIFIFGSLSLYALLKSYKENSLKCLSAALGLAMLAALGKETGLVFFISYAGYALLDLVLFKRNKELSRPLLGASIVIGGAYAAFIKSILGGYTASYKSNMSVGVMLGRFHSVPGVIKLILVLSVVSFLIFIWDHWRGRRLCDPLFVVLPIWLFVYVLLLLPWGFPGYLLAPLGPFIMGCVYFLAIRIIGQRTGGLLLFSIVIVAAAILTLAMDIIPKISKMADKRKVVDQVRYLNKEAPGQFFYPEPFLETAGSLQEFTSAQVLCVERINASSLVQGEKNYLIVNDEAAPVFLNGVDIGEQLYHNGTWGIWLLHQDPDVHKMFKLLLPHNIVQKIKNMVRRA